VREKGEGKRQKKVRGGREEREIVKRWIENI
jgi:hypothetical protein